MTAPNDGGAAFPNIVRGAIADYQVCEGGMSLRAYFAGQAMAAFIALTTLDQGAADTASCAVAHADALIAELAKVRP